MSRVRVFLRKQEDIMGENESAGVVSVAKRSARALADGTLTQETYALLQQRLAQEQFPNDSIGVALAKFYRTPHGAEMLNRGLQKNHEDTQKRTALGYGYDAVTKAMCSELYDTLAKLSTAIREGKRELSPATRQRPLSQPDVRRTQSAELDRGEPDDDDKDIATRVKELMNREGLSYDAAISRIHRAEKIAKGFNF